MKLLSAISWTNAPIKTNLVIILISIGLSSCSRPHFLGNGMQSPETALQKFSQAILDSDYMSLREVIHYKKGYCGGMDLVSINPANDADCLIAIEDHLSILKTAKGYKITDLKAESLAEFKRLLADRIMEFRKHILYYCDAFKTAKVQQEGGEFFIRYPVLAYDPIKKEFVPRGPSDYYTLELKKIQNRWYISNLQCIHFGVFNMP